MKVNIVNVTGNITEKTISRRTWSHDPKYGGHFQHIL
jgi:hypothetical protein